MPVVASFLGVISSHGVVAVDAMLENAVANAIWFEDASLRLYKSSTDADNKVIGLNVGWALARRVTLNADATHVLENDG